MQRQPVASSHRPSLARAAGEHKPPRGSRREAPRTRYAPGRDPLAHHLTPAPVARRERPRPPAGVSSAVVLLVPFLVLAVVASIALHGPVDSYLERLDHLLKDGRIRRSD